MDLLNVAALAVLVFVGADRPTDGDPHTAILVDGNCTRAGQAIGVQDQCDVYSALLDTYMDKALAGNVPATDAFLDVSLEYLGFVYSDANLVRAVRARRLLMGAYPSSPASQCIGELARQLQSTGLPSMGGTPLFWRRLLAPDLSA